MGGKCIHKSEKKGIVNFSEAQTFCKNKGGKIYEPSDIISAKAIENYVRDQTLTVENDGEHYGPWIGLERKETGQQ